MSVTAPWRVALCAGGFSMCAAVAPRGIALAALVAVVLCVVIAVVFEDRRGLTALAAVAVCALGTWRGVSAAAADRGPGSVAGHLGSGAMVLRGTVGDTGVPGRDDTLVVEVRDVATASGSWSVRGGVVVEPRSPVRVLPGDTVEVATSSLRAPPRRPGALAAASLERVGVSAVAPAAQVTVLGEGGPTPARLAEELRRGLAATVGRALPEPQATLLLGVAFGIHGRIPASVRTPLQDAGLVHIVAVSGLKVVMVAGLVAAVARARQWPRRRTVLLTIGTVALYVMLSGAGAAAIRSSLMVGAGLLLSRDGRRVHSFSVLGLSAALLLAIEPAVATDVGFQLSFLGTAGILALASPIAAHVPGPRLLAEPFAVTVAAQLATAPVSAATFGVLSLVGPFANALVLPLLPLVIVAGGAGALATLVTPALGWAPLVGAGLACQVIEAVARAASSLPLAAVHVMLWPSGWTAAAVAALAAGALAWRVQRRWRRFGAGGLPASAAAALAAGVATTGIVTAAGDATLRVTVLDVGNGVAVLIRAPGGGTVLVDGGPDGSALLTALGRAMSPLDRHLDAVVLTAVDRVSSAAVAGLIGHYDVGSLVVSQPLPQALQTTAAAMAGTGTTVVTTGARPWGIGGLTVRCSAAGPEAAAPCALQATDGRATLVVAAALSQAAQDELAGMAASRLRADLLVSPTTTAPSASLLAAVRPALVAVPAARIPPGLGGLGIDVAVTGRDGDLGYDAVDGGAFAAAG